MPALVRDRSRVILPLLPNSRRALLAFLHDVVMAALSFAAAFYLRLGGDVLHYEPRMTVAYGAMFTAVAGIVFLFTGLYRGIWRYASLPDLFSITKAATLTVLIAFLGGPRLGYRLFKDRGLDHILERSSGPQVVPVLLVSARDGADTFIRETLRDRQGVYRVVGVLSDTRSRVGREIYGVPVLGVIDDLETVVAQLARRGSRPQKLIVTAQGLGGTAMRDLLERADALAIPLARLPRATELRQGLDEPGTIEPIAIEDLLGRPQAVLDREAMAELARGRRILVTGAGGTIGSELSRQLAALAPASLVLFDNSEYLLYSIDIELRERFPGLVVRPLLGDVRDRSRVAEVLAAEHPEVVFHAAALKHVPMVELNPVEGVLTNVVGSRNVAEAARVHGVRLMVQISTDKAVNPTSVMGATKRLAEAACQALDLDEAERQRRGQAKAPAGGTRFVTVRFGNVLGSTGSVVPLFTRQLAAGGPLTVTDPDVTRFFMTVREAVELVLEASATAARDETENGSLSRGKIFVLDMGEPVRIVDLAQQMIRLAGRIPGRDVTIEFTGLRPGEKLHEELFHDAESAVPTANPALRLAAPRTADYAILARSIDELEAEARAANESRVLDLLQRLVPEYRREQPSGEPERLPRPTRAL